MLKKQAETILTYVEVDVIFQRAQQGWHTLQLDIDFDFKFVQFLTLRLFAVEILNIHFIKAKNSKPTIVALSSALRH